MANGVPNVVRIRILANSAVVLAVVLGSRTVGMMATHSLITHGAKASRHAKVGSFVVIVSMYK